ncbi:MAG: hypothetical protein O2904_03265 [bacterium]|nr:hypothetical protein [bacterium]
MSFLQSPTIGQHFAFAHGRTGVLQQLLLTQSDVDRLLGASSGREVEKILTELKLTTNIDQGISDGNAILQATASWIRNEVEQMSPDASKSTFNILWLEGDAPILSYLIKDALNLTSAISTQPTSGLTAYDPEALRLLVQEKKPGTLPAHLVDFVTALLKREYLDPQTIDEEVACYIASVWTNLARTSGSKDIQSYVEHRIAINETQKQLRKGEVVTHKSFVDPDNLEQGFSRITAHDIAKMWNTPLSIEPLFAFAATAIQQLKLVRMILIGKRNGLSPQEIKQALPPFLSASHYVL